MATADLAQAITELLESLGQPDAVPDALLAACQAASNHTPFDVEYITDGTLHQDLRDLLAMVEWSLIRGATRVRLLVRSRGVREGAGPGTAARAGPCLEHKRLQVSRRYDYNQLP